MISRIHTLIKSIFVFTALAFAAPIAMASYALEQNTSRVSFISTKNAAVAEVHHFKTVAGSLSDSGDVTIIIDLASVETNIGIRNTRMQEHLFDVANNPTAIVTGNVDMAMISSMAVGSSQQLTTNARVNLHGKRQSVSLNLLVTRAGENELLVTSLQPVVIQASAFDLVPGLNKLQELAKLNSITHAVPVSVVLKFKR